MGTVSLAGAAIARIHNDQHCNSGSLESARTRKIMKTTANSCEFIIEPRDHSIHCRRLSLFPSFSFSLFLTALDYDAPHTRFKECTRNAHVAPFNIECIVVNGRCYCRLFYFPLVSIQKVFSARNVHLILFSFRFCFNFRIENGGLCDSRE